MGAPLLQLVPTPTEERRTCRHCGEEKAASLFQSPKRGRVCVECNKRRVAEWAAANPERIRDSVHRHNVSEQGRARNREQLRRYREEKPAMLIVLQARQRAKRQDIDCTITTADVRIPPFCPVLGIRLERARGCVADHSPTLDRIDPSLGYVPGNVAVISNRANRIKNDGTSEEHELIAQWMRAAKGSSDA